MTRVMASKCQRRSAYLFFWRANALTLKLFFFSRHVDRLHDAGVEPARTVAEPRRLRRSRSDDAGGDDAGADPRRRLQVRRPPAAQERRSRRSSAHQTGRQGQPHGDHRPDDQHLSGNSSFFF